MKLPDAVKAIRAQYVEKFPVPQSFESEGLEAFEPRVRAWSIKFAETVAFRLPGQGWGVKRADPGRPIGKDSIARKVGDSLLVWDLLLAAGTGNPRLNDDPESEDITGQFFETRPEFFQSFDHLGGEVIPEPGAPKKPCNCDKTLAQLEVLAAQQAIVINQASQLENLIKQLNDHDERRYQNLTAQNGSLVGVLRSLVLTGSLRVPILGSVSIRLTVQGS